MVATALDAPSVGCSSLLRLAAALGNPPVQNDGDIRGFVALEAQLGEEVLPIATDNVRHTRRE
jgi:hypothetical protein